MTTANARAEKWTMICVGCGTEFVGERPMQRFCAPGCRAGGLARVRDLGDRIIELRRAGLTWKECGIQAGLTRQPAEQAQGRATKRARGLGVSLAMLTGFGRHQKANYCRPGRSERIEKGVEG